MKSRLAVVLGGIVLFTALLSILLPSLAEEAEQAEPKMFVGTFDPFEALDTKAKPKPVMTPRPKCGVCHARATIARTDEGRQSLRLVILQGRRSTVWTMLGTKTKEGVVFTRPKVKVTYANNTLTGLFDGRMRARISLKPAEEGEEVEMPGGYR
jgi:hypothetical protein